MLRSLSSPLRTAAPFVRRATAVSARPWAAFPRAGIHHAGDPYVLPHTPEHIGSRRGPAVDEPQEIDLNAPELPFPDPIPRPNESVDALRARLVYQSRKRGTLEADLLMSTFARDHMPAMSEAELRELDKFLDENDWDAYYWATEKKPAPERWADSPLLAKLREHARNEGKVVRRMPSLHDYPKQH